MRLFGQETGVNKPQAHHSDNFIIFRCSWASNWIFYLYQVTPVIYPNYAQPLHLLIPHYFCWASPSSHIVTLSLTFFLFLSLFIFPSWKQGNQQKTWQALSKAPVTGTRGEKDNKRQREPKRWAGEEIVWQALINCLEIFEGAQMSFRLSSKSFFKKKHIRGKIPIELKKKSF